MDIRQIREIYEGVRKRLIQHLETERSMAAALKGSSQRFNYQYNHGKDAFIKELFGMFELLFKLEKKETGYKGSNLLESVLLHFWALLQKTDGLQEVPLESAPVLEELPYFERLALSKEDPAWEVERRGRPTQSEQKGEKKCADPHTFKGRIKDAIRKKYKLGGKDYCQQAEEVWERKREDLMQAVHRNLIPMSDAKKLLAISPTDAEWQDVLSRGNKKIIQAFMKARGLK